MTAHNGEAGARGEIMLQPPQLSFACELDSAGLADLFADPQVIDDLQALKARVALMCSDFSDERAGVVRRLNAAGVPVTGIPLLPLAEGYFTTDNADRAVGSYQQFMAWTGRHELVWHGVGLDIEPDARIFLQITKAPRGLVPMLAPRLLDRARPGRAKAAYRALVQQIGADGWRVENYQGLYRPRRPNHERSLLPCSTASPLVTRHLGHCIDRAGVCRGVPFRLWDSCRDHRRSAKLWGFCGAPERLRLDPANPPRANRHAERRGAP